MIKFGIEGNYKGFREKRQNGLKMGQNGGFGEKGEKGQKWSKIAKKWPKMVFLGDFPKSSKKNFIFALIRPPKKGRAQPLKRRVDFWHFWIETI